MIQAQLSLPAGDLPSPMTAMWCRRCFSLVVILARSQYMAPSMIWPCAVPDHMHLSVGFILEEGFALAELARIVESMAQASREANVPIVTGDTKVVERGKGDGVFINTSGVGIVPEGLDLSGNRARPGDCILLSGSVGDHGACILTSVSRWALRGYSFRQLRTATG